MTVRQQRQLRSRILQIAAHTAVTVADGGNGTKRAIALDLNGHRAVLVLQLSAHHRSRRQRSAQRSGCQRQRFVNLARALNGFRCAHRGKLDLRIAANRTNQSITHILSSPHDLFRFSCQEENAFFLLLRRLVRQLTAQFDVCKARLL